MKTTILAFACALATLAGCTEKPSGNAYEKPLENPTKVTFTQRPFTNIVDVTWQDNSDKELGYVIWRRDGYVQEEIATLDPNTTEFSITKGLEYGVKYNLGVQAKGPELALSSQIIYKNVELYDYTKLPRIALDTLWTSTPTSVVMTYSFVNYKATDVKNYGLCWCGANMSRSPVVEDGWQHGPVYKSGKLTQAITSASLDHGKDYIVRGYVETEMGYSYSNEVKVRLGDPAEAIKLNWTEITPDDFPAEVKVYKTSDQIHGRPIDAWYAIADVSTGKVQFRFEFAKSKQLKTLEDWYETSKDKGNIVMTNAGYFNMTTGAVGDYCVDEGVITPAVYADIPKGAFGVDKQQKPYAFWTAKSTEQKSYYFNEPEPNIRDANSYYTVKENYPSQTFTFEPWYAMCAGPLLVKDGKVMTDVSGKKDNGADAYSYSNNYELIAPDIFTDEGITPDRTAVGYTADGKIILFICDGRIKASKGASIVEIAQLMLGLDCVGAVNFDGGGSTAMILKGERQNSLEKDPAGNEENRPVGTVMGFYVVK